MTMQSDVPAKTQPSASLLRIAVLIILAGVVLWYFGVFRSKPKIAIITSGEGPYWDLVVAGAHEAAQQYDVNLKVVKSRTDAAQQTQAIRELLKEKYDGIAVSPINPDGQADVLYEVAMATTLVTLDSDSPVSNRLCFVGTDNYHAGRLCGEQIRKALPDGGEIIISLGSLDKDNTRLRRQGVIDELLERPFEPDHPMDPIDKPVTGGNNYTIVTTLVDGGGDADKATELAVAAIKANPNVKCLVGLLGYSTPALLKALEQTGSTGKIQVVGFDQAEATLNGIENGHVFASILQDQFGCGFQTVRILAENARGNRSGLPMFQRRTLPCEVINRDNVASIRSLLASEKKPS